MKGWQFDAAFVVALALLVMFSVAPYIPAARDVAPSPLVVSGVGLLLGYVFTRRQEITKRDDQDGKD